MLKKDPAACIIIWLNALYVSFHVNHNVSQQVRLAVPKRMSSKVVAVTKYKMKEDTQSWRNNI